MKKTTKVRKAKPEADADETPSTAPVTNARHDVMNFLEKRIEKAEASSNMVRNTSKYLDPQSTGSLCVDWLFNGGLINSFTTIQGPEQSGKTTILNGTLVSGLHSDFLFSSVIDAEATFNDKYFAAIALQGGIDLSALGPQPFRYYRESVIEPVFDYMVNLLNGLPRKIWSTAGNSWTYVFPKNDAYFKEMMERYGVKPDRALTTEKSFVCPTDNSGIEAAFYIDSLAALLTENDEENEERSKVRAAEATAFSLNLKRVSSKIANRGCLLLGTNQERKIPGVTYGSPTYAPGGEALKFYSTQRASINTRTSGYHAGLTIYDKDVKALVEPSVLGEGKDRYSYKAITNTKNKPGNPNKSTWIRIWQADHQGNAHGIDPYFDTFWYLMETKQIKKGSRVKGKFQYTFALRDSVGKNRAAMLNALPAFTELDLKRLVLSEVFGGKPLISKALTLMGLSSKVHLRKALFDQLRKDPDVLALSNGRDKSSEDDDYEDGAKEL